MSLFSHIVRLDAAVTSSLVAADEHFHRKASGYQLEVTARSF